MRNYSTDISTDVNVDASNDASPVDALSESENLDCESLDTESLDAESLDCEDSVSNNEIIEEGDSDLSTNTINEDCGLDCEDSIDDDVSTIEPEDVQIDTSETETSDARLDTMLDNFQETNWDKLELDEQKELLTSLGDCLADTTGNKNPPEIIFSDTMEDGEYGAFIPETNTLEINENMLDDSSEAVDTVAHEMWHAYQQQCACDPTSEKGREYQDGFDDYISPEYDFEGYENQMVETEAREFAQGIKNRLSGLKGGK